MDGTAKAGPASQCYPKRRALQSLEDAASELARARGLLCPLGPNQRETLFMAVQRVINALDLNAINLNTYQRDTSRTNRANFSTPMSRYQLFASNSATF